MNHKQFMAYMAEYYSKKLSVNQIRMYAEDLKSYPVEGLKKAWKVYKANPENKFFPLPEQLKRHYSGDFSPLPKISYEQGKCFYCSDTGLVFALHESSGQEYDFECGECEKANSYSVIYQRRKEENPGFKIPARRATWNHKTGKNNGYYFLGYPNSAYWEQHHALRTANGGNGALVRQSDKTLNEMQLAVNKNLEPQDRQ